MTSPPPPTRSLRLQRLAGVGLLFAVIVWGFLIHLPALEEGYFDAGDDHIHAVYTNEIAKIWKEDGRLFGWSQLYGGGFPIFLLRPPGIYFASAFVHVVTGISVEDSLKLVVVLGFCLFPLAIFIGARLLGLGFWPAVLGGLLAPLPISLWGHTIDAYHYLGVHKQLLAILMFPPCVGALWCLLREGRHGLLFAALFPLVLMTHPYIAYCLALLPAAMLVALFTAEPGWDWRRRIPHAIAWSVPTLLLCLLWLIPFYASTEIQPVDPFLSVRKTFDVVVCTTAETLRQLFLGGVLDTTRWAGTFGGPHEWGWLSNAQDFRLPVLTGLALAGLGGVVLRPRSGARAFLALAFLISTLLLIGPDDFPILDRVPFAMQFQNIHAIFVFEWAAITLGGLGWCALVRRAGAVRQRSLRVGALALVLVVTGVAWVSAISERTSAGQRMIRLRNNYTENGELLTLPRLDRTWAHFGRVADRIRESPRPGGIAIRSSSFVETVLFNLLPHMTDRPVFTSGFQKVGGVYPLLRGMRRDDARTNLHLQSLYGVRFVVTRAGEEKGPEKGVEEWPESMRLLHEDRFWELREVEPEFGSLEALPSALIGFVGSEREWAPLMKTWLSSFRKKGRELPWILNFTHTGLSEEDLIRIRPYLRAMVVGDGAQVPAALSDLETLAFQGRDVDRQRLLWPLAKKVADGAPAPGFRQELLQTGRANVSFRVYNEGPEAPVLFKRAFYRGWRAQLDGREVSIYRISPGFQMILLPPGEHRLVWRYAGPNGWTLAKGVWLVGLVLALALRAVEPRFAPSAPARAGSRGALRFAPAALWGGLIVVMFFQTWSEAVLKRPVPIRPPGGRYAVEPYNVSRLDVYWNYVLGIPRDEQDFRVEISSSPDFEEVLASEESSRNWARFDRWDFEPGRYYYRVRLETDEREYGWTRPVGFEISN